MEESFSRPRGLTYDAELLLQQRHNVKQRDWMRKYRHFRNRVYDFLDHPTAHVTLASLIYHLVVFGVVLASVIIGASTEVRDASSIKIRIYSALETFLAVFFLLEFIVRMWAISADAKYAGFKGHMRYLRRIVSIADITIIFVTFVILLIDKRYITEKTMDYLRLIQILRLFHIDRQMSTWRLIKNMVIISRWELFSAYYITFVLFLIMANLVYYTEHFETHANFFFVNSTEVPESPIPTLAHAWWFSIVSILTVGYGDIVPRFWASKVIVCVLGFLAYCTFVTASTQISVGLTLMMEEDNKKEYKNKLRHNAASLIQSWYRYHLANRLIQAKNKKDGEEEENRKNTEPLLEEKGKETPPPKKTKFFKDMCYKLYLTGERLKRMRAYEKKAKEKRERFKKKKQKTMAGEWKNPFRLGATTQVFIQAAGIPPTSARKLSTPQVLQRHMSLPVTDLSSAVRSRPSVIPQASVDEMSKFYHSSAKRNSVDIDTTVSSSYEGSDSEQTYSIHEEPNIEDVDDKLLQKYQPLLSFFCYLWFQDYLKKFQRLRKADKLLEMEAEIVEQIHERDQKINELEYEFTSIVGEAAPSTLDPTAENETVVNRLNICEEKVMEICKKIDMIDHYSTAIIQLIAKSSPPPPAPAPAIPHGLPPPPPGRALGRRLKRQTTCVREEDDEIV